MPLLEDNGIYIRSYEIHDSKKRLEVLSDPHVLQFLWGYDMPKSEKELEMEMSRQMTGDDFRRFIYLTVCTKKDEQEAIIGFVELYHINWVYRHCDIGIFLFPQYCNNGLGTKIMKLMLEYCFLHINLNRVGLCVHEDNVSAIKVYKKVGFIQEGCERQFLYIKGEYKNNILFSILKSDYLLRESKNNLSSNLNSEVDKWSICKSYNSDTFEITQTLSKRLVEYNSKFSEYLTNIIGNEYIAFTAINANNEIIGGIYGLTKHNNSWLHIDLLWVHENYRNLGIATSLIKSLEQEGTNLGCQISRVESYNFQARPFYEKQGYIMKGKIDGCPSGTTEYILIKSI